MFRKINIRDDDVLLPSTRWAEPMKRFRGFHNLVCQDTEHFIHVPAILCTEIMQFPEIIEYIQKETFDGRMIPQIHGLRHIDYGKLPYNEVVDHLGECLYWFTNNCLPHPVAWFTPWGATQEHLHEAAEFHGLRLVDTSGIIHPGQARDRLVQTKNTAEWEGRSVFRHWWESVGALDEFVKTYRRLRAEQDLSAG